MTPRHPLRLVELRTSDMQLRVLESRVRVRQTADGPEVSRLPTEEVARFLPRVGLEAQGLTPGFIEALRVDGYEPLPAA